MTHGMSNWLFYCHEVGNHGQIVQVLEMGNRTPHKMNAKKYVVMACLMALANVGYNIPTFSSMLIQALNEDLHNDV
jgi:hypothetical protein